jgi:hypothetical protein
LSGGGTSTSTTLWRAEWRTAGSAAAITSATGEPSFYGGQFDTVVHGGRVYWASARAGGTEVRSVGLKGGNLTAKRFKGDLALTTWPFAVSVDGGRGRPVTLVNYDTGERTTLPTGAQETATCSARWCRIGVLGAESLDRIDLVRPDGRVAADRRRGPPTLVDVALLDRSCRWPRPCRGPSRRVA